ncbi:MAG: GAF and ANTAR domain-containing protein [Nitriliruptor sp.]|uniref:ANTAR domain-containing protein n=1 Tax=Nitriliruptor sp. TaxID=2448056 RepID=UPI0034A0179B
MESVPDGGTDVGEPGEAYLRTVEELLTLLLEEVPFDAMLEQVIALTAQAIATTDAVAVTVERVDGRTDTAAASDAASRQLDEVQRALGTGPCVDAMADGNERYVDDLTSDDRWPSELREEASRLGLHCALVVPLRVSGRSFGALNLFARQPGGLDEDARRTARSIAGPVAATLANARAYSRVEQLSIQLREAITSRAVIEQAKGILMVRVGCDEDEAFALLRRTSQHQNRKLRDVAAAVVAMRDQLPARRA